MAMNKTTYHLAAAYQMISHLGWDDATYTHLSARPKNADYFYIIPFGFLFSEAHPDLFLKVDFDGKILNHPHENYNLTGFTIHSPIYQARPDVNAIFHLHTPESIAVSSSTDGLLPISQHALHFYEQISYHAYDSLTLHKDKQGRQLVKDLKNNNVMLMRHHGALTCGTTIAEAFYFMHHLQKACEAQCKGSGFTWRTLTHENCIRSRNDLLSFEKNLGERDFKAIIRLMQKMKKIPEMHHFLETCA